MITLNQPTLKFQFKDFYLNGSGKLSKAKIGAEDTRFIMKVKQTHWGDWSNLRTQVLKSDALKSELVVPLTC